MAVNLETGVRRVLVNEISSSESQDLLISDDGRTLLFRTRESLAQEDVDEDWNAYVVRLGETPVDRLADAAPRLVAGAFDDTRAVPLALSGDGRIAVISGLSAGSPGSQVLVARDLDTGATTDLRALLAPLPPDRSTVFADLVYDRAEISDDGGRIIIDGSSRPSAYIDLAAGAAALVKNFLDPQVASGNGFFTDATISGDGSHALMNVISSFSGGQAFGPHKISLDGGVRIVLETQNTSPGVFVSDGGLYSFYRDEIDELFGFRVVAGAVRTAVVAPDAPERSLTLLSISDDGRYAMVRVRNQTGSAQLVDTPDGLDTGYRVISGEGLWLPPGVSAPLAVFAEAGSPDPAAVPPPTPEPDQPQPQDPVDQGGPTGDGPTGDGPTDAGPTDGGPSPVPLSPVAPDSQTGGGDAATAGDDRLAGGSGDDVIDALAGDDVVKSGAGDDAIDLGAGDDIALSGSGADTVLGGDGNDTVKSGAGNDSIDGGAGDDVILSGDGNDTILGGDGNDTIKPGRGDDVMDGGAGDDILVAFRGDEMLIGGAGNDTLLGNLDDDTLIGGAGDDRLQGGPGRDVFVFDAAEWGHDRIVLDFLPQSDTLDFRGSGLALADLSITQAGDNVLIEAGDSSILVNSARFGPLNVADFAGDVLLFG
ncbi:Hemolysin-type calcium-binding repeat-containing protein [Rubrimonas cliftonensis]|uniref:Hemolysin-type calcium-binding repeat-containing protein n=2 Tax=Rubrimonas cliftonensis TaxID=89524 RepID=A0A1H4G4E1_9RHOB|nr:Hemolysin-type calcium-binding repeat-containing protein [Rubrimonas cliftonensis]